MGVSYSSVCDSICKRCVRRRESCRTTGRPFSLCKRCDARVKARNAKVEENAGLAHHCVRKFFYRFPHAERFYSKDDAIHDCYMAMMRAIELYDEDQGPFSSYAFYWMQQALGRGVMRNSPTMHIPNGTAPEDIKRVVSIHSHEAIGKEIYDKVSIDEDVHRNEVVGKVRDAMRFVTSRELEILKKRMEGVTMEEIGGELGISRERVRQLGVRARRTLSRELLPLIKELDSCKD